MEYQVEASVHAKALGISNTRFIGTISRRLVSRLPNRIINLSFDMRDEGGSGVFNMIGHTPAVVGQGETMVTSQHSHTKDWHRCMTNIRLPVPGRYEYRVYFQGIKKDDKIIDKYGFNHVAEEPISNSKPQRFYKQSFKVYSLGEMLIFSGAIAAIVAAAFSVLAVFI